MACHYLDPGPTHVTIGAVYTPGRHWLVDRHKYKLHTINEATGVATLERLTGAWWDEIFVSVTELSRWTMVRPG